MIDGRDHDLIQMSAEEAELICSSMHIGGEMRKVLLLGCVEGQSLAEIAEALKRDMAYIRGLLDDAQLLALEYGSRDPRPGRDLLDAVRNTKNTNPHTPHYAKSEYTGELQKVQLRTPYPNEGDLDARETWRSEPVDVLRRGKRHDGEVVETVVVWAQPKAGNGGT
jgi:hypothetical protein